MERGTERIGTTIRGKYRIDSVLGVGGMAVVYAATHRNKKRFAIKMLHPEISMVPQIRERFLREGYVANTVDHPGAVAVLDDDVAEDGAAFLVMELLRGSPVDVLWESRDKRLPLQSVLAITHQFLDILTAAHAKSIVHRDLKPANLFLTQEGIVKVLDFGIARLRDATSGSGATQSGAMMGTPAYIPPEQAGGRTREIDGQTDLWAVGATMFTLLSGEMVHEGENAPQVIIAAATRPARSLAAVWPEAPPLVVDLVARALAFDKSERWATAAAMQNAVRSTYRELFRADVSSERLAGLLGASALPPTSSTSSVDPQPVSRTALQLAQPAITPIASTNAPVSATGGEGRRTSRSSYLVFGGIAALCAVIGAGAAIAHYTGRASASAVPIAPVASEHPSADPPAGSTVAISIPAPSTSVVLAPLPVESASTKKPTPKPTASASASAAKTAPVSCDPPFTVDPQTGKHVYKKECL